MKKTKDHRNFKIFAPKRKFMRPRNSKSIPPGESFGSMLVDGYEVYVKNMSDKIIYVRYE